MELQEAKNLSIGDIVFIIDKLDKVCEREIIGTRLVNEHSIDITYVIPGVVNDSGFILSHGEVFLEEKYALGEILRGYLSRAGDIELKVMHLKKQIRKLEMEAT
jgi:hypothetical protein